MTFYLIGVIIALVIGIFGLVSTEDIECNIEKIDCIFTIMVMSLLSWILVLVFTVTTLRDYYVKDD